MLKHQDLNDYRAGTIKRRQIAECSDHECIALAELIAARKKKGLPIHEQEAELRLEYSRMKHATQVLNAL